MHLGEIISLLETKLSPKIYSLDNDFHGIQYGESELNRKIKKIMLTLDLSLDSIHNAIIKKVNLIISYRSLIRKPIYSFNKNL
ncbi:MAG: Nif3-like dinuclear metal center hexameric protein, partial [Candidatus Hermodarchaeota archaeon]